MSFSFVVQLLSQVQLFETPWTAACQASPSFTSSQSLLKLLHWVSDAVQLLLFCRLLLLLSSIFPSIMVFSNESLFASGGQSIRASASVSVLPMNIQVWFPLGFTGLISLQSKAFSRVFASIELCLALVLIVGSSEVSNRLATWVLFLLSVF